MSSGNIGPGLEPFATSGTGIVVISILVLAIYAFLLWWMPLSQNRKLRRSSIGLTEKEFIEFDVEYRKTVTSTLGGAIVALSIVIGFWQLVNTHASNEQNARSAKAALRASTFAKGFDLIGSSNRSSRVIGIKILDSWANDEDEDDGLDRRKRLNMIAPALMALIRQEAAIKKLPTRCEDYDRAPSIRVEEDVRAALDVVREWSQLGAHSNIALDNLNLAYADLTGFNLNGANLEFSDFSGATISGATLVSAKMYCINLYGADVSDSDMSQAQLAGALIHAHFKKVDLSRSNLRSAVLSDTGLEDVKFVSAHLENTNFFRAHLQRVDFTDSDVDRSCFVQTNVTTEALNKGLHYRTALVTGIDRDPDHRDSHCFKPEHHGILDPGPDG